MLHLLQVDKVCIDGPGGKRHSQLRAHQLQTQQHSILAHRSAKLFEWCHEWVFLITTELSTIPNLVGVVMFSALRLDIQTYYAHLLAARARCFIDDGTSSGQDTESSPGQSHSQHSSTNTSEDDAKMKAAVGRKIEAFRDAKEELGTVMYFI